MTEDIAAVVRAKRKLVEIKRVPLSKDQPIQILLKRNGVFLHGCKTDQEVEAFLLKVPEDKLISSVQRKRSTR